MTPIPWYQITRWNYIAYQDAEPPKPTLYTCLTIDQYGYVFLGIVVLNIGLQMLFLQVYIKNKSIQIGIEYKKGRMDTSSPVSILTFNSLKFSNLNLYGQICKCLLYFDRKK